MPRHKATNRATGETLYYDWDGDKPPSQADIRNMFDKQREARIAAKSKVVQDEQGRSFMERLAASPVSEYITKATNALGLNQPWMVGFQDNGQMIAPWEDPSKIPAFQAGKKLIEGGKQIVTGTGPEANPRLAGLNKVVQGTMGTVGAPLTALGYATGIGGAANAFKAAPGIVSGTVAAGRAMAPVVGGFTSGTLASEGTRAGIEAIAPDTSPEVKELLSTTAGLGVGGAVAYGLSRGGKPNSTSSGPIKPVKATVSMGGPQLGAGPAQTPPPTPPMQGLGAPPPQLPPPTVGPRQLPPGPFEMPPAGTYQPEPPPPPLQITGGGYPMPPAGTAEMLGQFRNTPPQLPEAPPLVPPARQLAPPAPATPDVTSAARPEPLSPSEIPSVNAPPPLAREPLGPAQAQGPIPAAPPPAGSIPPIWNRSPGEQTPAPPLTPALPEPQPIPPPVQAPTVVEGPKAPLPPPEVPAPAAVPEAALTPEVLPPPPVAPPMTAAQALAQAALRRSQGKTVDVTPPKAPLPPPVFAPGVQPTPSQPAAPPQPTQEVTTTPKPLTPEVLPPVAPPPPVGGLQVPREGYTPPPPPRGTTPAQLGARWTQDPGAIPGEPEAWLDHESSEEASLAIVQDDATGKYHLMEPGGKSRGSFPTMEAAAAKGEKLFPQKSAKTVDVTPPAPALPAPVAPPVPPPGQMTAPAAPKGRQLLDTISTGTRDTKLVNAMTKLYAKKPDITAEEAGAALKKLFPESAYSEAAYTDYAHSILGTKAIVKQNAIPDVTPPQAAAPTALPEVKPLAEVKSNVSKTEAPVESPSQLSTPEQKRAKLNNDILDFAKRRKDITIPQLQTQFGVPGDVARDIVGSLVKRGLLDSDKRGKFNYKAMPGEEQRIAKEEGAPPPKPTETPEVQGPRGTKIKDLRGLLEKANEDKDTEYAKVLEERIAAQEKQAKLEGGTKTQKGIAAEIDNVESQIDKLEDTNESAPELAGLYRKLAELEKKRDRALMPESEKYSPQVVAYRSLHAEAQLAGLDHAGIKAKYGLTKSMKDMTPQELGELEEQIKTDRLEKEAEIQDLEEKDMNGTATPEEKSRLKEFWKDETGSASIGDSLKYIAGKLSSRGPMKGTLRKQWSQSGETTLNKEGGGALARDIRRARTEGEIAAGNLVADFRANTKKLTNPEFKNMMEVLQGTARAMSQKVADAAREEDKRIKRLNQQLGAQKVNIDPINSPRTDRALLPDFYTAASNKVAEYQNFGVRKSVSGQKGIPEDVLTELDKIKAKGGDFRANFRIASAYFNPDNLDPSQQAQWDKWSGVEIASKLGMAVIGNLTQPANVTAVVGNLRTLKAGLKMAENYRGAEEFALRAGSILSSVTHETQLSEGVTPSSFSGKMLEGTGFSPVEVNNRILASMAGAEHAVDMFKRLKKNPNDSYARRHLEHWLGLDPNILVNQNKLTMDQIYIAAHTLSDRTQFRTSPLELPLEWKTSITHRMMTLFKSFAFNHAKFMKDAILGEVKRGNFRPLIPLLTTFPILGRLADMTKRKLVGRNQPISIGDTLQHAYQGNFNGEFWDSVLGTYTSVGGAGIASDIATRAIAGKLANYVVGPIAGDAVELVDSIISDVKLGQSKRKATRDKMGKNVGRFALRQVPVVGRPLAGHFFPYQEPKKVSKPADNLPYVAPWTR